MHQYNLERRYAECDDCHIIVGFFMALPVIHYLQVYTDWLVLESEDETNFYCPKCRTNYEKDRVL